MKNFSKNIILWIVIGLLLVALFNLFQNSSSNKTLVNISFSDFMAAANSGNVSEVNIEEIILMAILMMEGLFTTYSPNYPDLVNNLNSQECKD